MCVATTRQYEGKRPKKERIFYINCVERKSIDTQSTVPFKRGGNRQPFGAQNCNVAMGCITLLLWPRSRALSRIRMTVLCFLCDRNPKKKIKKSDVQKENERESCVRLLFKWKYTMENMDEMKMQFNWRWEGICKSANNGWKLNVPIIIKCAMYEVNEWNNMQTAARFREPVQGSYFMASSLQRQRIIKRNGLCSWNIYRESAIAQNGDIVSYIPRPFAITKYHLKIIKSLNTTFYIYGQHSAHKQLRPQSPYST